MDKATATAQVLENLDGIADLLMRPEIMTWPWFGPVEADGVTQEIAALTHSEIADLLRTAAG